MLDLGRLHDGAESHELFGAVASPGRIRRMAQQHSACPRRHRSGDRVGIERKLGRLELDEPRVETDMLRVEGVVEPTGGGDDDFPVGASGRSQCDVECGHRARRQHDVLERERELVAVTERIGDGPPRDRVPPERRVLKIEQPLFLERLRDCGSRRRLSARIRIRVREVRESIT